MDCGKLFIQQSCGKVDTVWKFDFLKLKMYLILFGEFELRVESGQEEIRANFCGWQFHSANENHPILWKDKDRDKEWHSFVERF